MGAIGRVPGGVSQNQSGARWKALEERMLLHRASPANLVMAPPGSQVYRSCSPYRI